MDNMATDLSQLLVLTTYVKWQIKFGTNYFLLNIYSFQPEALIPDLLVCYCVT